MQVRSYNTEDKKTLVSMFMNMLTSQHSYISHGEIQMGLSYDGKTIEPDAEDKWERYLERHYSNDKSYIYVLEHESTLVGFAIFGIEDDYDKEYGVIYDILVAEEHRGLGASSILFQHAIDKLKHEGVKDCYLESGVDNHRAHSFFEKKGFKHVSNIYRLENS